MQCPRCGYALTPSDTGCPRCAWLAGQPQASSATPAAPLPRGTPYKVCIGCGQRAVLSQVACGRCGTAFPVQSYSAAHGVERGRTFAAAGRAFPMWVLGPILAVCIVGLAVLFHPGVHHPEDAPAPGSPNLLMVQSGGHAGADVTGATPVAPGQIDQRLLAANAHAGGDIEVSLAWNGYTDLDLSVMSPSGDVTDFLHPSTGAGDLDVDANAATLATAGAVDPAEARRQAQEEARLERALQALGAVGGGPIGGGKRIYTDRPIEHVYVNHAERGTYSVYVRCFNWREATRNPVMYAVQIKSRGRVFRQLGGTAGPASFVSDQIEPTMVCQFEVR